VAPVALNEVLEKIGRERLTLKPDPRGCSLGDKVAILTEQSMNDITAHSRGNLVG